MSLKDLTQILERAWKNFRILLNIPILRDTSSSLGSLINLLGVLEKASETSAFSPEDESTYKDLSHEINAILSNLETAFNEVKFRRASLDNLRVLGSRIADCESHLTSFLQVLRSHSQNRIRAALQHLRDIPNPDFQLSITSDWATLEIELLKYGISKDLLDEEFFFINESLKRDLVVDEHEDEEFTRRNQLADQFGEEEELPGYTPGPKSGPIEEKASLLQQTRMLMTSMEPDQSIATSSVAAPPYTFEEGIGEDLDDDITLCIRKAKQVEANQRSLAREQTPEQVPRPYDWLPKAMISEYKDSDEVKKIMEPSSFSTMAYETSPRCAAETNRLRQLLKVSYEDKKVGSGKSFIEKVLKSLDIVSIALYKFILARDQQNNAAHLSDLDALDFEFSTVAAIETQLNFPQREFDLAQKSYYSLLTYIMGYLEALSSLMPSGAFIVLPLEELERMWKDKRMDTRIAWMEKWLAGWDQVQGAVLFCREWHKLRPGLRVQATANLRDWERSRRILSGSEGDDIVEFTIISASGLPKSNFMVPSAFAKLVVYGPNEFGASMRLFSHRTDPATKTQNPVWNKAFLIKIPPKTKMIHIEICDKIAGIDVEMARARLRFSYIPGLEASFEDRSLMHGIEEELDFPAYAEGGKGKQKEPCSVRIGLKWKGRYGVLEELGLPARPPGEVVQRRYRWHTTSKREATARRSPTRGRRWIKCWTPSAWRRLPLEAKML